jgi:hypothetical protein
MLTDIGASAPSAQLPLTRFTRNPSRNDLKGFETGVNRQANAALFRVAIVRMKGHEPTLAYVKKDTREGKSKKRNHSLPETLHHPGNLQASLLPSSRQNRMLTDIGASEPARASNAQAALMSHFI